ncbi:MAG: flagellar basal body P-ring protein FlgI [Betaproteobacteria bacterium]|nr:flagellar basal body P-ring protein FlgI [Betaproteobacteria bacterium]
MTARSFSALFAVLLAIGAFGPVPARAERIKDLANIQGVRVNQLIGYGIIAGLDGSGDQTSQTPFTAQSVSSMLSQMGVTLPPGSAFQLKNVAAVMVTAMLPAFATPGQQFDITVSSLGNAKSLRGGTLLLTPLKGTDGRVYAIAQGNVVVGGAGASAGGSKAQINQLNAGRIPGGATVERAAPQPVLDSDYVNIELHSADFDTARRVAEAINTQSGERTAQALDARLVQVLAPREANDRVSFLARLEGLTVEGGMPGARVIINARTGSVVMNRAVTLQACAVAHGNLSIMVNSTPVISQPGPFSQGQTVVAERAEVQIRQEGGGLMMVEAGAQLSEVVKALNALGANPQDLVSILQAIKASGALRAELEVI